MKAVAPPQGDQRVATVLGIALGISFTVCFTTGVFSHLAQNPVSWFGWPSRPAGLYRITQGLHVVTGFASIPLLLAKLWVVYPKLWRRPLAENVTHAVERVSLLPLVGGSIFLLASGVFNVARWYPWPFFFPAAHYWAAWLTIGALIVHIGAKAATAGAALRRAPSGDDATELNGTRGSRRAFLGGVAATTGVFTVATAGSTVGPLSSLAFLAQRRPNRGPQGVPINKSAMGARVIDLAADPAWRLAIVGDVAEPLRLSLAELQDMPQHEAELPIACVEGWSASAPWTGVRVRDLLQRAGAPAGATVAVESLQPRGLYRRSSLHAGEIADRDCLVALALRGEPLHIDHGFPARLIGPNRPGVLQTKWLAQLTVMAP